MNTNDLLSVILRYSILIILALGNFFLISKIFGPLTIKTSFFILSRIFSISLIGNSFGACGLGIVEIISACVAASAYFLLITLNLSTPQIKIQKRILSIIFSISLLFFLNIYRIVILSSLHFVESKIFDVSHLIFWYLLSVIFVISIWFFNVYLFNIKKKPFYDDIIKLYKNSKLRR